MNNKNLNLGTPLLQGSSHAVMPSLGHGTGLLYRERETPARAPINIQGIGGSQIRQKPLSGQLRKGNWSYSLCNIEPLKPRISNMYIWGLGENRGVHGKLALRLLRHKTTNTGAHKINRATE